MNIIELAVMESRIETAENRIRNMHNATCKTRDIMPEEIRKFIKMINTVKKAMNNDKK